MHSVEVPPSVAARREGSGPPRSSAAGADHVADRRPAGADPRRPRATAPAGRDAHLDAVPRPEAHQRAALAVYRGRSPTTSGTARSVLTSSGASLSMPDCATTFSPVLSGSRMRSAPDGRFDQGDGAEDVRLRGAPSGLGVAAFKRGDDLLVVGVASVE